MFAWNCSTAPIHLVAGLLFTLAPACSGSSDRTPADTTSLAATAAPTPDSTGTVASGALPADTPAKTTDTAAKTRTAGASEAPAPSKPRVRPSIDPGRKAPTPAAPAPSPARSPDAAASAKPAPAAVQGTPVKYDAATNTVTFDLIGGPNGFQFNGHASGSGTLTLPPKANVVMNFVNKDGTPHSAEVISGEGPLPNAGVDAALPRAYTNQLLQGLPQEASDVMRFQAPASGAYRIFCGVPGHGLSGMWIWMKVDPAAKTAAFGPTKG